MMMDVDSDLNPRMASETATKYLQLCVTCKQPNHLPRFKNCMKCREKNRHKRHLADQRKQQRDLWAMKMLQGVVSSDEEEGDGHAGDAGSEENHVTRPGDAPSAKKKKPKFISELDGKERDVALLEMKNGLKRKFGKKMVAPALKPTQSNGTEYQTASVLYDILKRKVQQSSPSELQFYGYHTIVANQDINNRMRTKMVVDDIRKIVRVPLDLANVQKFHNATTKSYGLVYPCACLGYDTPAAAAPSASANSALIKGTQGDLIRQARARLALSAGGASSSAMGSHPAVAPAKVRRECGGRVRVLTKDDNSHPLGILGQKISVRVMHG